MNILFFGQKGHWATDRCLDYLANMRCEVEICLGTWGDVLPEDIGWVDHDLIISFLSPWIIPGYILKKARIGAINFHPGSPGYPGLGGVNSSIYNKETEFGVTCHHMREKPYSGNIIAVSLFPLFPSDTAKSLTVRCHYFMFAMFVDVVGVAIAESRLLTSDEAWARPPYTRKHVDDLRCIDMDMSQDEILRRVWATNNSDCLGAYIDLSGIRFEAMKADR